MAGDAAPDGVLPREPALGSVAEDQPRSRWSGSSRRFARAGPRPRATSTTGARASKVDWGWNWSETRKALDYLYVVGDLAIAGRNAQFEPVYDVPERVLPLRSWRRRWRTPRGDQGARAPCRPQPRGRHGPLPGRLLPIAAPAGRGHQGDRSVAIDELVEEGELLPVSIEGWKRPAYLHRDAKLPRKVDARALLSPFDPVVWERERTEHIFDFHYRIEIYVPEPKRQYGYYVLPFLLGDRIVGRVDLKADRKAGAPAGEVGVRRTGCAGRDGAGAGRRAARPRRLARPRRHRGRSRRATSRRRSAVVHS